MADLNIVKSQAQVFAKGYLAEDVNGDGTVDALDLIQTDNNAAAAVSVKRP
jgi:hypothetical protein